MADSVLIPLYVYPSVGAWSPVLNIATSYPHMQFTAIVNVYNGPGDGALPNEEYSDAITLLNSLNNVRTIGYVATTWCARDLGTVLEEIAAYSFWGEYDSTLALDGIFFDETPTLYSPDSAEYLHEVNGAVYSSIGLKDNYIVHNPGALPEPQYFDESVIGPVDLTIIFENTFSNWTSQNADLFEATQLYDRDKLAVILHSVPELTLIEALTTLQQMLQVGRSIWLTGSENYTHFDATMSIFVDSLAQLLS